MRQTSDSLTIRSFPVRELVYGGQNTVTAEGWMSVDPTAAERLAAEEELIHSIAIRVIRPEAHHQYTSTIMDIIPLAAKVSGTIDSGVTHTLTGVYVLLTGTDEKLRQVCNFGSCEGILEDKVAWGMPGTPLKSDLLISFDVVLKEHARAEREGVNAAHRACDRFCQVFREQLRRFPAERCAEERVFREEYRPDRPDVFLVKEVSGQGANYDTRLYPAEPGGYGCISVIETGHMPAVLTPNELRDGILRALD